MAQRSSLLSLVLAAALVGLACQPTRYVLRRSGPTLDKAVGVLSAYEDPQFAREAAPALLSLLEGLLASDPTNPAILATLCRGLYEYTFGFLQQDLERLGASRPEAAEAARRRARHHYVRVYELGLRLLRTHGVSLTLQRTPPAELRRQVARLDRRAAPALAWTAVGAGGALQLGIDQPWLMQMRAGIGILLERAHALDPGFANALPAGALGLYHAVDADSGGSAITSQRYFEQALSRTGRRYLPWLVLYAKHWAWQFQSTTEERSGPGPGARLVPVSPRDKRALFVSLLEEVRRFPLERAPEHRLANRLAKDMAEALLPKRDDFLSRARQRLLPPSAPPGLARVDSPPWKGGIR